MNNKSRNYQVGPDKTRVQAVLTRAGRDSLGIGDDRRGVTMTELGLSPSDVRRRGLARLAFRGAAVVLSAGALVTGAIEGFNYVNQQQNQADQVQDAQTHKMVDQISANEQNTQPIAMPNSTIQAEAGAQSANGQ